MHHPTSRRLLPAGLALVVALAACGGGDDADDVTDTTSGADTTRAAGAAACDLLTLDEVAELFGEPAAVVPSGGDGAPGNACLWESEADTGEDDAFPIRHQLSLSVFEDDRELDPSAWGEEAEPIDDLGDEAFVVSNEALGTTAGYRQERRSVILTYLVVGDDAVDPADNEDDLVDLLRTTNERSG